MSALVAVAHGSRDPRARDTIRSLVAAVRATRPGLEVHEAFLDHEQPSLGEVLAALDDAVVVPLLLGAGFHSVVDIPATVAAAGGRARQSAVLGPHPMLLDVLERRLGEQGVATGGGTAVVLAAAGSTDPTAVAGVHGLAAQWSRRRGGQVRAGFASAGSPGIEEAVRRAREAGARRVAVGTYLLAPGVFAERIADAARSAGADTVSDVLGAAPEVVRLVLHRYDEAGGADVAPPVPALAK